MAVLRAIRDALANLAEGRDPTALRLSADDSRPSDSLRRHLLAIEQTERYVGELKQSLPVASRGALETAVAHAPVTLTSLPEVLNHVSAVRAGQSVAVGRAGLDPDHAESRYAVELGLLENHLRALLAEQQTKHAPNANFGASDGAA